MKREWAAVLAGLVILGVWVGLLTAFVVYVLANTTFA